MNTYNITYPLIKSISSVIWRARWIHTTLHIHWSKVFHQLFEERGEYIQHYIYNITYPLIKSISSVIWRARWIHTTLHIHWSKVFHQLFEERGEYIQHYISIDQKYFISYLKSEVNTYNITYPLIKSISSVIWRARWIHTTLHIHWSKVFHQLFEERGEYIQHYISIDLSTYTPDHKISSRIT